MGCQGSKEQRTSRKQQRTMRKYSQRVAKTVVSSAITDAVAELVRTQSVSQSETKPGAEADNKDEGDGKKFRRTFSLNKRAASKSGANDDDDEDNWIHLTDEDDKRIRAVHKDNPQFSRYELQRVFAAVKENGGSLGREEFAMVYSTYAKLQDHSMALSVFDLFDVNHDGAVSFEELVPFLEIMVHGSREDRAKYCFQLFDRNNKGEISQEDFATFVSKLPVDHIMDDFQMTRPGSRVFSEQKSLPSLLEEDDETEDGERVAEEHRKTERAAEEKKEADARVRAEMVKSFRKSRGDIFEDDNDSTSAKPKAGAKVDTPSEKRAKDIATKVFEELGQDRNTITLQEFVSRINTSPTLQAFFPF
ncbi:hypothetical protein PTSG_08391 [Salpingoeca rosetta]|uniref:EF-hand domain-containing protein n=1 Tax=Salpingoeca rosetta (strain ATCC 50818 / BSB-021) TaxID=946362 RepID=F2UJJ8_SALR5|nr:uncharacterized protein PTSG_08391 [Salpingoeca rosetta]EGD77297.1 hypothetical protein PTSG_08391 [Salpingoeca rosetta]|eukprot:XP_004990641.1 hypothetical protein PTSG_08391 [Salpingoeca rosetta]